jgi:hypothetical protein
MAKYFLDFCCSATKLQNHYTFSKNTSSLIKSQQNIFYLLAKVPTFFSKSLQIFYFYIHHVSVVHYKRPKALHKLDLPNSVVILKKITTNVL